MRKYLLLLAAAAVPGAAIAQSASQPAAGAAQPITRAAVTADLSSAFKAVDTNNDNSLSQAEIAAAETKVIQARLAEIRTRMEAEFTRADTNKDGQLSKAEFLAVGPKASATGPTGAEVLNALDKNSDKKVTLTEFSASRLAAFDSLDANKDGTLTPAEERAGAQRR